MIKHLGSEPGVHPGILSLELLPLAHTVTDTVALLLAWPAAWVPGEHMGNGVEAQSGQGSSISILGQS